MDDDPQIPADVLEELRTLRAELAASREGQQRLRAILENAPLMIDAFDADGRCTLWNRACERILGYSQAQVRDHPDPLALFYPDAEDRARVLEAITRGDGRFREYRVRAKDASLRLQRWANFALPGGGQIAFGYDVTEQRLTEEKLRASEGRLRALVGAVPDLIFRMSGDGTYLDFLSGRGMDTYVPADQIIGGKVRDLLPPNVADPGMAAIERALATGEEQSFEYELADQRGLRTFEARVVPSGADEVVALVRDVTEHRRIEAHLRDSQKLEALGQLTAGISHDFNNLLTVILGNLDYIASEVSPGDAELSSAITDAQDAARSGAKLIRKLLAFGRREMLSLAPVELDRVLREFAPTLRRLLPEHIDLRLRVEGDLRHVLADAGAVEQIVLNLATNARDAMPRGGRLGLAARPAEVGEDHPAVHAGCSPGDYVVLSVSDTGHGIDLATRERVFDPFFTTKAAGEGSGLGLTIVYGLAQQHRGFVELDSEPGQGTTARVYFPIAPRESLARAQTPVPEAPRGGNETILFVEDEAAIRRGARRTLEQSGYAVLEAGDGAEALEVFRAHRESIALVVSDVVMPRMSGPDLYAAVRAGGDTTPFLFVSGYTARDARASTGLDPALPLFHKPWTVAELLQRVREALDAPR